jgi:hypothetical protein
MASATNGCAEIWVTVVEPVGVMAKSQTCSFMLSMNFTAKAKTVPSGPTTGFEISPRTKLISPGTPKEVSGIW